MRYATALTALPIALSLAAAIACGPSIAEQRLAYFPPKDESCSIAVINGAMQNPMLWASPASEYELVGTISLNQSGTADPFSEDYMKILRPRACKMGADAVSLMMSTHSNVGFRSGTGTDYALLKKRVVAQPPSTAASQSL